MKHIAKKSTMPLTNTTSVVDKKSSEESLATERWDFDGIGLFRVLGYIVGLPSFIVGTALFMLGFSLLSPTILNSACILYSVAIVAIVGRMVLLRVNPQNEKQALLLALGSLAVMGCIYALLLAAL